MIDATSGAILKSGAQWAGFLNYVSPGAGSANKVRKVIKLIFCELRCC